MLQPPGHSCIKFFGSTDNAPPIIHKQASSGRAHSSILRQTCHVCPPNLESTKPNSVLFCANDPRNQATPGYAPAWCFQPPGHRCIKFFKSPDDAPPVVRKQTRSDRASFPILRQTCYVCSPNLEGAKPDSAFCVNNPWSQTKPGLACPTFHSSTNKCITSTLYSVTSVLHYNVWH